MADVVQPGVVGQTRYKDMGDGTYASVMYVGAQGAGGGPAQGTLTDRSGTITSGGASQQVMAANASRKYLLVQNNSVAALWVNFTGAAVTTQPAIQLAANGGSIVMEGSFVSTEAVTIIGATTGQVFTAKEG